MSNFARNITRAISKPKRMAVRAVAKKRGKIAVQLRHAMEAKTALEMAEQAKKVHEANVDTKGETA